MEIFHEILDLMKPCAGGEPKPFFSNLKAIKREVDAMLAAGHDWAADHISTSKDDMGEVHAWLRGRS